MRERTNRSDRYQYIIAEIVVSEEKMNSFRNSDSIAFRLNPFQYNEELDEAKEQLRLEFWKIVDSECTPRQKEVLHMLAAGMTQQEIADKLQVNQSSVAKSVNGNVDYIHGARVYGGAIKKLKKAINNHPKINEILERIAELSEEKL